jgi:Rad3-related DNA helicase
MSKKLANERNRIHDYINKNIHNDYIDRKIVFYECPTGLGKTGIALANAYKLMKKYNTSVIISTNTNDLALNYLSEQTRIDLKVFNDIDLKSNQIKLMLGKSNYADINKIKSIFNIGSIKEFDNLDINKVNKWFKDRSESKTNLVDIFLNDFNISSEFKELINFRENDEDIKDIINIKNFPKFLEDDKCIYITNHLFLLTLVELLSKDNYKNIIDFYNIPIFLDEAHDLIKLAKLRYSNNFSIYRFKSLLTSIKLEKEDKTLKNIKEKVDICLNLTINKEQFSLSLNDKSFSKYINKVTNLHNEIKDDFQKVIKRLQRITLKTDFDSKVIYLLKKEFRELSDIMYVKEHFINFNFSEKKGYMSINSLKYNPNYELRNKFWANVGNTTLLSGTFRTVANEKSIIDKSIIKTIERLGLIKFKEENSDYEIFINNRIKNDIKFKCFDWIFPKENFEFICVNDKELDPISSSNKDKKTIIDEKLEWAKNIAKFIKFYYEKDDWKNENILILTGGYSDTLRIFEQLLIKDFDEYKIFYERKDERIGNLFKRYKKNVLKTKGNIFIGTLTSYTGLNFAGDLCSVEIMTKLPFAPFIGLDISNRNNGVHKEKYKNEMKLLFRQGIGRPIRSENDFVRFFILDNKINRRYSELKDFLKLMGREYSYDDYRLNIGDWKNGL